MGQKNNSIWGCLFHFQFLVRGGQCAQKNISQVTEQSNQNDFSIDENIALQGNISTKKK